MKDFLDRIFSLPVTEQVLQGNGPFVIEENLATGILFAGIFRKKPANYALLCSNQYNAQRLYEFLLNFLKDNI